MLARAGRTSLSLLPLAVAALLAVASAGCTDGIGVACPSGQIACGGTCTAIADDADNCGGCGMKCAGEIVCIGGQCACPKNQTNCGDVCVRLANDPANCGACGNPCAQGAACGGGKCLASGCTDGQMNCSGSCVDTQSDNANCGGCAQPCDTSSACVGGACKLLCENNLTACDDGCADTQNDPLHCGDCDKKCNVGEFCAIGTCIPTCMPPMMLCTSAAGVICIDPNNDPGNCGGCNMPCTPTDGLNTVGVCIAGNCGYACQADFAACGGGGETNPDAPKPKPGEPTCATEIADDSCNCGGCDMACDGWFNDGPSFCGAENPSQTCCDASCQPASNFLSDTSCGSCGSVTDCAGETCCPKPVAARGAMGACVDTTHDILNCGGCGNFCDNENPLCCDNGGGAGCVDASSVNNCGGCNNACTGTSPACCGGSTPGTFGCIDTATDQHNCGACGNDCDDAATAGCTGATCVFIGLGSGSTCQCP